ncbi:GAF domain-containing protein [Mycolicibacterium sp. S2-37]|uniref:GAF domain-containing protein n=1 Tax=Mycolicibacterium sp. S2-37 TaxID=2810297 RepID=UPI001A93DFE9|nr:GAF domain-containing protein [Mycolicibacterium sp. S2-37]MBO0677409.1 GAF domain-containing protein [Mycolicibacterium sp. S2-37]
MTPVVPGFDEWLTAELAKEAAIAGESIEKFISRSVAARMAVEQARRGDRDLDEILERVRRMDLELPEPGRDNGAGSVLADPERLQALYETGLLDTDRGRFLDRIVEMAVAALGVPSAAVTLVDHESVYLPSAIGLPDEVALARQIPLGQSISRPIVSTGEAVITADARTHPALMAHPMVLDHYVVSYAGFPISDDAGHTIGALSVWDRSRRDWSVGHLRILADFAEMVHDEIFSTSMKRAK